MVKKVIQLQAEREDKIQKAKSIQEYEEMKSCTFTPHVNQLPTEEEGPIVIRGLGKHLERTEKAKKIEQERKEREEQVFRPKVRDQDTHLKYTIPEPFNLHSNNDAQYKEMKQRDLQDKWEMINMAECTFKPKTNADQYFANISELDIRSMLDTTDYL
ncbi:hypothetical protein AKO1_014787 [Acrasis kona]|uniref:Uncharacterized protein n=1 Tax=Acrasis kona TaxID=1008807 RepID=A0AAW2ZC23_9EUKA